MKKQIIFVLVSAFLMTNVSFAATNYDYESESQTYTNKPLKGHLISVPAGSVVPVVTTRELSSESLVQGQMVQMALGSDFYFNNQLIAPAGSVVAGTVTVASKAKYGAINGKLKIMFTQITTPQGLQIPISGVIKTTDGTGVLVGGTKADVAKEYAKDVAVGSAAGALSGLVFGAIAGGDVGKGAALGTAVGAGGGLVKAATVKGDNVVIPANSALDLILSQPITVQPQSFSYED